MHINDNNDDDDVRARGKLMIDRDGQQQKENKVVSVRKQSTMRKN